MVHRTRTAKWRQRGNREGWLEMNSMDDTVRWRRLAIRTVWVGKVRCCDGENDWVDTRTVVGTTVGPNDFMGWSLG